MYRKTLYASLALIVLLAAVLTGCGPAPPAPDPFYALGGDNTVDISDFNGKCIYSMVTAQPPDKPESDNPPSTLYAYTLTTTSAVAPSRMVPLAGETAPAVFPALYPGQAQRDLLTRRAENEALASRARQLTRRAPPAPITVGTNWDGVNVWNSSDIWVTIDTTCVYVSDHAYFFVDDRDDMGDYFNGALDDYGADFDQIYQTNHDHFGEENDTDGNGKVIVIFSQELTGGLLGYFYAIDKYDDSVYEHSNEGDIFYITTDAAYQGDVVKGTLAHEFQHMIYFDQHYDYGVEDTYAWLNEALSQAAEYYNGYLDNHLDWISYFLNDHWAGLSLTHWTSSNYGYGAIYIRYLIDQYGDGAIRNMCSTANVGVHAVEAATGGDFNTIFNNFTRALVLSGTGDTNKSVYNFSTLDLQSVQPNGRGGLTTIFINSVGDIIDGGLYPYRISFLSWTGDFGTMNLSGASMVGTVFGISQ